jgi:hypothetical protein
MLLIRMHQTTISRSVSTKGTFYYTLFKMVARHKYYSVIYLPTSYFLVALARFSLTNGTGSAGRLGALTGWNSLRLVGGVSTMS